MITNISGSWRYGFLAMAAALLPATAGPVAASSTTTYEYNAEGDVTRVYVHDGATTFSDTYTEYDALGRQVTVYNRLAVNDNAGAMTTTYAYDLAGHVTTKAIVTDSSALLRTVYEYDALGRQVTVKGPSTADPLEGETIYNYDLAGNVTYQKVTVTSSTYAETYTEYDALNRATKVTDPIGMRHETGYDSLNRPWVEYTISGSTTLQQSRTVYDNAGRAVTRARVTVASDSRPLGQASHQGVVYAYDDGGRATGELAYDTDAGPSLSTAMQYDGMGRKTQVIEAPGTGLARTTGYVYSTAGLLVTLRAYNTGETQDTAYDYDSSDLVTLITYPLGDTIRYSYYANGAVATQTLQDDTALAFYYDLRGHMTTKSSAGCLMTYAYDCLGRMTYAAKGQRRQSRRRDDVHVR